MNVREVPLAKHPMSLADASAVPVHPASPEASWAVVGKKVPTLEASSTRKSPCQKVIACAVVLVRSEANSLWPVEPNVMFLETLWSDPVATIVMSWVTPTKPNAAVYSCTRNCNVAPAGAMKYWETFHVLFASVGSAAPA